MVNYGFISIPERLTLIDTYFENRGNLLVGYQLNGLNALRASSVSGSGVNMTVSNGASIAGRVACTATIEGETVIDNYGSIRTGMDFKKWISDLGGGYGYQ